MTTYPRYTSRDLELLPDVEGTRYEIIDGDLFVSKQPSLEHQYVCLVIGTALFTWSRATGQGRPYTAPGLVFDGDDDVAPDVVWISHQRLRTGRDAAGHLRVGPELAVEVVSPGAANERRDREFKLKLYSRQGVREYWIVDWQQRMVQVYRRASLALALVATLWDGDMLTSPLLPEFGLAVSDLWEPPEA
ncbi:MAG: Uma2 family endonuclease [Chloroflexi bacterium]|nr:Uma2 family endonuclease [Chloroflexota bacterium]